jgi:hypothetical protein
MEVHVCPSIGATKCADCVGGTKPAILFCAALDMNTVIPFTENLLPLTEKKHFEAQFSKSRQFFWITCYGT